METLKRNRIIAGVISIVIGLLFLAVPEPFLNILSRCIGIVMLIAGIASLALFFTENATQVVRTLILFLGGTAIAIGVWVLFHPEFMVTLIPRIFGIVLAANGVSKLLSTMNLVRANYEKWWVPMILALISIAAGLALIVRAYDIATLFLRLVGLAFAYDGASDIWIVSQIAKYVKIVETEGGEAPAKKPFLEVLKEKQRESAKKREERAAQRKIEKEKRDAERAAEKAAKEAEQAAQKEAAAAAAPEGAAEVKEKKPWKPFWTKDAADAAEPVKAAAEGAEAAAEETVEGTWRTIETTVGEAVEDTTSSDT